MMKQSMRKLLIAAALVIPAFAQGTDKCGRTETRRRPSLAAVLLDGRMLVTETS